MSGVGTTLRVTLLLWAVPTWSFNSQLPRDTSDGSSSLNYSGLIGQESHHVVSAWGAPVRQRPDDLNITHDFGNMVLLGGIAFPRPGRLLGWRAYFTRTDVPVDFQIWRAETGKDPGYMKLIAHTGPVFAESLGPIVFTLSTLGVSETYFNESDVIGLGLESASPVSMSWSFAPCPMWEGKTEGFLLTCTRHRFRRMRPGCTTYSAQALIDWMPTAAPDACLLAPSVDAAVAPPGGPAGNYPPGADYEMPVYTMPCKEVLLNSKNSYGHLELANFTGIPIAEDVCMLLILNLGDTEVTSRYALRADVTVMAPKMVASKMAGNCSPLGPLIEFQEGPFMASRVVRSFCEWNPDDHAITVCERHLRIRLSNRGKLDQLRIEYHVIAKAATSCKMPSPWFPRSGSRVSAIVAIIVISLLAVVIAFGVTKLAKRGAPLFRERTTSPNGSELFTHDDLMYRTSLTLSSPTSSTWPGDHAHPHDQVQVQQGHLFGDATVHHPHHQHRHQRTASASSDVTSLGGGSERIIDVTINDLGPGDPDDDLLTPLSPRSLTSVTSLSTPTSGPAERDQSANSAAVMTISQLEAHKWDRIT